LPTSGVADQVVRAFTAPDFPEILSKKNMLALIVFSILVGLAAASSGAKGEAFRKFLESGNAVMNRLIALIMLYAPIGLGAYFGYLVGVFGPQLLGSYGRAMLVYYPVALIYFVTGFSVYAWIAAGGKGVKTFWSNIIPTALTAWGTGSSVATIPTNLAAAEKVGVPRDVREVVIPLGATIHMDGSCLAAILKIAALFSFFGMPFDGVGTFAGAVAIAILAGTVISGIPSGGMLGEILIITIYGFPIGALPLITMIGTLVDPPATMLNSVGDNVASMVVARAVNGKDWMGK
jgi:Na+/H+-dicarboxylate symporter